MTPKRFKRPALCLKIIFTGLFLSTLVNAQTNGDQIKNQLIKENSNEHKTVINKKMVDRFNAHYDDIEVIDWVAIFANSSIGEFKEYLAAYNLMDLNNSDPKQIQQLLNEKLLLVKRLNSNPKSVIKPANPITMIDSTQIRNTLKNGIRNN